MTLTDKLKKLAPIENHKAPSYLRLWWKYNTLKVQNEEYERLLKEEAFKLLMHAVGDPDKMERLTKENRELRIKNKHYKETISEYEKHNKKGK